MNDRTDYKQLLEQANKDLAPIGKKLILKEDEEGYFSLHIREKSGKMTCYAENYFENELEDLIAEACADAKASPKKPKTQVEKENEIRTLMKSLSEESQSKLLAELYHSLADNGGCPSPITMTEERYKLIGNAIADGYGVLISDRERSEYWKEVGRRHRERVSKT